MDSQERRWIGLVRAIGPLTHKKMSMAELRTGCAKAGFKDVRTVLTTGNVIFTTDLPRSEIGKRLAGVLASHDLQNEVFLRRPKDLKRVLSEDPFPDAARDRPNHMLVLFMSTAPAASQVAALERFEGPERIRVRGHEAYIDYKEGVGRSKLTPVRLEKLLGQSGTARNWNTICKLVDRVSS